MVFKLHPHPCGRNRDQGRGTGSPSPSSMLNLLCLMAREAALPEPRASLGPKASSFRFMGCPRSREVCRRLFNLSDVRSHSSHPDVAAPPIGARASIAPRFGVDPVTCLNQ
jgi:hypothetical protein